MRIANSGVSEKMAKKLKSSSTRLLTSSGWPSEPRRLSTNIRKPNNCAPTDVAKMSEPSPASDAVTPWHRAFSQIMHHRMDDEKAIGARTSRTNIGNQKTTFFKMERP